MQTKRLYGSLFFVVFILLVSTPPVLASDCAQASRLSGEAASLMKTDIDFAEKKLRDAINLCYQSASLQYNLGLLLFKRGRYGEAETRFAEAVRINKDHARGHNAIAYLIAQRNGDIQQALEHARKSVDLEPNNLHFRDTLSMVNILNVDAPPASNLVNPNGVAVVIGNRNYKSSLISEVEYAANDAAIMKRYLIESLGYREENIIMVKDATYVDFLKIFGDMRNHKGKLYALTRGRQADVLIYYSGHGAPGVDPQTKINKPFLVPSDTDPYSIHITGYSLDLLYDNLYKLNNENSPRSITVVLDTCFSGVAHKGTTIPVSSPIYLEVEMPILTSENTAIFSSSQPRQVSSWYPEKNHGLFTYFFLKSLKKTIVEGRSITAGEMERSLLPVNEYAMKLYNREQNPQLSGNRGVMLVNRAQ